MNNVKSHILTTISSLEQNYRQAVKTGKLYPQDIYLLNIINNLLECNFNLSNKQKDCLNSIYDYLLINSKNICPVLIPETYQTTPIKNYTQSEISDENDYTEYKKIIYWQSNFEQDYLDIVENLNIATLNVSDTYLSFEIGKLINFNEIGKICFLLISSGDNEYTIFDILGNNITDSFHKVFITNLNSNIYISKNIYSHGEMYFKINKTIL